MTAIGQRQHHVADRDRGEHHGDHPGARDRSAATSAYRPSAAAALIRGISAVMIETATMPCAIIISR